MFRIASMLVIVLSPVVCYANNCYVTVDKNCNTLPYTCDLSETPIQRKCTSHSECGLLQFETQSPNIPFTDAGKNPNEYGGFENKDPIESVTCGRVRQCRCLRSEPPVAGDDGLIIMNCTTDPDPQYASYPNVVPRWRPYGSYYQCIPYGGS